jgi:hypothetical protein
VQVIALTLFIVWILSLWLLLTGRCPGLPWLSFQPAALLSGILLFVVMSLIGLVFVVLVVAP